MKRTATANWKGTGKEGTGTIVSTQSGLLKNLPYTYVSRFESGEGTNPEELVAAAHAGCYSMKLSFVLNAKGYTPDDLTTDCTVTFEGGKIATSELKVKGKVPGISADDFKSCAEEAKKTCPISLSLNVDIKLEAELL